MLQECAEKVKQGVSPMVWVCFLVVWLGPIIIIEGAINQESLKEKLAAEMLFIFNTVWERRPRLARIHPVLILHSYWPIYKTWGDFDGAIEFWKFVVINHPIRSHFAQQLNIAFEMKREMHEAILFWKGKISQDPQN